MPKLIWLSFNPFCSANKKYNFWPRYLQLSLGYGVNRIYTVDENKMERWKMEQGDSWPTDLSSLKIFLSLDIDLKLPYKNPFLKTIFHVINIVKLPFPALEYNCKWFWIPSFKILKS